MAQLLQMWHNVFACDRGVYVGVYEDRLKREQREGCGVVGVAVIVPEQRWCVWHMVFVFSSSSQARKFPAASLPSSWQMIARCWDLFRPRSLSLQRNCSEGIFDSPSPISSPFHICQGHTGNTFPTWEFKVYSAVLSFSRSLSHIIFSS